MGIIGRIGSEITYLRAVGRALARTASLTRHPRHTLGDFVRDQAARHGARPALIAREQTFSYRQLHERANQYARWAGELGLEKGACVALMMGNCPEYVAVWLGIVRAGGCVALVNTHLAGRALAHCLNRVPCRHAIVAPEFLDAYESAARHMQSWPQPWISGRHSGARSLEDGVAAQPPADLVAGELPALTVDDPALYIFTSGTTGMPKAARITHYRALGMMHVFSAMCGMRDDDRLYLAQPLYHTAAGVAGIGMALASGGSAVIADRFSARRFWDDVVDNDCTCFQYIGEMCRYLLEAPTSHAETRHAVRFCTGNGLRRDIWRDFGTRFRPGRIIEWYGATEGNVVLFNLDGKPGAAGRILWWLDRWVSTRIVRFDVDAEHPVRGADGRCVECAPGEAGEVIGKITTPRSRSVQRFEGYASDADTQRKILRDVFEPGDAWYRTGDIMRRDERGYVYFVDRIGDTFRWKGENVSTTEVEEVILAYPGVRAACVYGVRVRGHDGRAGMAAIVCDGEIDLAGLRGHIARQLPAYARPVFLRTMGTLVTTTTFKVLRADLRNQGFDPRLAGDPVFLDDPESMTFEPLDADLFGRIEGGEIRL
ncbi:MAG: long-chain-acyl-CoA synthetase [Rhodobiaceae bacterium]|nr:long-chain-acyl-CoA synthetase [Rhodobiaceae bacterium]MCC0054487.1 long-chain-acyl-CoA synthetase [Rhodobiaceae bacterium]